MVNKEKADSGLSDHYLKSHKDFHQTTKAPMQIASLKSVCATEFRLPHGESRHLYFSLLKGDLPSSIKENARSYLYSRLEEAQQLSTDFPADITAIPQWISASTESVGQKYQAYLSERKQGMPRRYFKTKSHALNFLKSVAPTKLVDGAWLYGLIEHWHDPRFTEAIKIYLEELGEGVPDKNHVVIYKRLLAANGCDQWQALSDDHYVQGAIQLALAHNASNFLPEIIGFNLGYEQLPLHLLITAYELNELGIDPYYFTLHVTIDNAATGHAQKAFQALLDAMPHLDDQMHFYRRVLNGYKLNSLGASTLSVIDSFDLDEEIVEVLTSKSRLGSSMHSDYCRVSGRTVNDWLSDHESLPDFLNALESAGWVMRHQDPQNSRFWKLIQGDHAEMFGVFNDYERQVIHDWIAGDYLHDTKARQLNYKARKRLLDTIGQKNGTGSAQTQQKLHQNLSGNASSHDFNFSSSRDDMNADLRRLEEELADLGSEEALMARLVPLISPSMHHTAPGLMATRIFSQRFNRS